ncbi:MAG TPA: CapA family protein [Syntrophomonadaceae bacterium]|nr:CapA family protein [Syntrophomonadaceae bacterium]
MKRIWPWVALILFINVGAALYYWGTNHQKTPVIPASQTVPSQNRLQTITLVAAGDCLMHNTQIWSGEQKDGSYSFSTFFPQVQKLIEEGDYTSTNFEAPMAGPAKGYAGYPLFNSPDAAADAFKKAGFDLVVTANNHIMDQGLDGALRTMRVLHQAGLDTVGTNAAPADSTWLIKDIKGVKVGYLAYAFSTNGMPIPAGHQYFFNFLDKDRVLADIKKLRPQVDVLILVLHWGLEYNPKPTPEQKALARQFLEAGADAILGSHPHVIQTMETIKINDQDKFVIYSMGNFISHQIGQERNSGIVLKLKFTKDTESGRTSLQEVSYTPTFSHPYMDHGSRKFRVVPVEETIALIKSGKEPYLTQQDLPVLTSVLASTRKQLGEGFIRK